MTEPMQPTALEEDGQLLGIPVSPYFVVWGSFSPLYLENSPQASVTKYFQHPSIFNTQWPGFAFISEQAADCCAKNENLCLKACLNLCPQYSSKLQKCPALVFDPRTNFTLRSPTLLQNRRCLNDNILDSLAVSKGDRVAGIGKIERDLLISRAASAA